jgi:hypothetical protein
MGSCQTWREYAKSIKWLINIQVYSAREVRKNKGREKREVKREYGRKSAKL